MASSSRLVGRLLRSPLVCTDRSYYAIPTCPIRVTTYATNAATTKTTEINNNKATTPIPDQVQLKKRRVKRNTSEESLERSANLIETTDSTSKSPIEKKKRARRILTQLEEGEKVTNTKARSNSGRKAANKTKPTFTADPTSPFPHLPHPDQWTAAFRIPTYWENRHRQFVANEETVESMVKALDLERRRKEAGRKLTILECYPGPGTLTRRLLQDENVEKVVALENHKGFIPWLKALTTDASLGTDASKLEVFDLNCYEWESYPEILNKGAFDHIPAVKDVKDLKQTGPVQFGDEWKATSPIIFISQFSTTSQAEQLLAQFTAAIPRRWWMFRYTRMPMFSICSEHLAWRCTAQPGHRLRNRMSLLAQSLTDAKILHDSSLFTPHEEHFFPYKHSAGPRLPRTVGSDITGSRVTKTLAQYESCFMLMEPRAKALIQGPEVDAFEYIVRNLFVRRSSSIKSQLEHLAPGAVNILDAMRKGHPSMVEFGSIDIDPETLVQNLTDTEIIALAKMFERWPFKPRNYYENIKASLREKEEFAESLLEQQLNLP